MHLNKLTKTLNDQNNTIGSLRGDIQKLNRARQVLKNRGDTLRLELKKQTTLQNKTTSQLQAVKKSASWKTGYVIVKAFSKPGKNTLLLPYRLLKILLAHSITNKESKKKAYCNRKENCIHTVPDDTEITGQHGAGCVSPPAIRDRNLIELRVASIVDEFTYSCFKPECNLTQLSPEKWQEEMNTVKPDLLFVEAAWRGKNDLWTGKIERVSLELTEIISWCRSKNIPTVFWAKEDPFSFHTFLPSAKLFDFVFTSDTDCIQRYNKIAPELAVYCLPFAAQPAVHNPIEKYIRKEKFCFAGSYYNRFPERQQDFDFLFDTLLQMKPVDIFDRNYRIDQNLFIFPDKFKSAILGSLPHDQIDKAYKGYKYAINMNSIKDSSSMFARRVFELLASNTVVVSNYSKAIEAFFGNLVINTDNGKSLTRQLSPLLNDETYFRKFRLLGLRKVLQKHTYEDRLAYMASKIWGVSLPDLLPHVRVFAKACNKEEFDSILAAYQRQTYLNKSLFIMRDTPFNLVLPEDTAIYTAVREDINDEKIGDVTVGGFIAGFVSNDYYGENYLLDNILATRYSATPVIGKGAAYTKDISNIRLNNQENSYAYVEKLPLRACIISAKLLKKESVGNLLDSLLDENIAYDKCLSIDEFNYCKHCTEETCPDVDDLHHINCGKSLSEILAVLA